MSESNTLSSPVPQQAAFIVYVAGVHVPVSNVSVVFSYMSFPVLQFSLPADPLLIKLGEDDRVPVVVFFLDKWYSGTDQRLGVTPTWRLLFDGDIMQWSFSKSAGSRSISFSAIASMSALNSMHLSYITGKGNEILRNISKSSVEGLQDSIISTVRSLTFFTKGAFGTGVITRPIDFVKNLMLGVKIGGPPHEEGDAASRVAALKNIDKELRTKSSSSIKSSDFVSIRKSAFKSVAASMEFFIKFNHRNKLDKRWIASDIEEIAIATSGSQNTDGSDKVVTQKGPSGTIQKTLKNTFFTQTVKRITFDAIASQFKNDSSPEGSFWNLITQFYNKFWYNILLLPTAQLTYVSEEQDIPIGGVKIDASNISSARLGNCISVPKMTYALPPACNVITPAMTQSFTFSEDYSNQNTRTIVNGRSGYATSPHGSSEAQSTERASLRFGYPTDQNALLESSNTLKQSPENILIYPEEYFKGPIVSRPQAPSYFLTLEQKSKYMHNNLANDKKKLTADALAGKKTKKVSEKHDVSKVSSSEWRQEMLYSFTKLHYLENKFNTRGGSLHLNFNPYLVPGLPFTMIDSSDEDQMHVMGLITSVSIEMSTSSASTSVSYTAGRTLKEVYEQVFTENTFGPEGGLVDLDTSTSKYDSYSVAPIMPVKALADTLQVDDKAATYYKNLFYTGPETRENPLHSYVYKHSDYFESTSGSKILSDKTTSLNATLKKKVAGKTFPGTISNVHPSEDGTQIGSMDLSLKVKDTRHDVINSYEQSMQEASRPICTLDEYMLMFNTAEDLARLKAGAHERDDEFGVPYPIQIRTYHVLPEQLDNSFIRPYARDPSTIGDNAPEMRRDWPSRILKVRNRIKNNSIFNK